MMFSILLLRALVALATLVIVKASEVVVRRTAPTRLPSCVDFTPFVYGGCFADDRSPRTLIFKSSLDFDTMTVESCVAFCKGNGYKYAGLEYYGECFCGASVNAMQIDESLCRFPCTGNKTESCGGNKAISIYQDPTFPVVDRSTVADYMPMGCYSEGPNGRTLAWKQGEVTGNTLVVEKCLITCKYGGYAFAGVEYGRECFCGVVLGNGTIPLDAADCDMRCTGDKSQFCGGRGTLNLYVARNLQSTEPCGYTPGSISSSSNSFSANPTTETSSTSSGIAFTSVLLPTSTEDEFTSRPLPSTSNSFSSSNTSPSTIPLGFPSDSSTSLTTATSTTPSSDPNSSNLLTKSLSQSFSSPYVVLSSSTTVLATPFTPSSSNPSSASTPSFSTIRTPLSSSTKATPTYLPTSFTLATTSIPSLSPTTSVPRPSSSTCVSLITVYPLLPPPICQYKLGNWCARPIPEFSDTFTCLKSVTACVTQLSSCFKDAGFPYNLECNKFNQYCSRIAQFCDNFCPGPKCSYEGMRAVIPSYGVSESQGLVSATIYTRSYACDVSVPASASPPTLLSSLMARTSTTCFPIGQPPSPTGLPIPTNTNICTQPNNPSNGYGSSSPVGGIPLPKLICNNNVKEYNSGYWYKLYTSPESSKCPSYRTGESPKGCSDACDAQYALCLKGYTNVYKSSVRVRKDESYYIASTRCENQRDDCHTVNKNPNVGSRCDTFGSDH